MSQCHHVRIAHAYVQVQMRGDAKALRRRAVAQHWRLGARRARPRAAAVAPARGVGSVDDQEAPRRLECRHEAARPHKVRFGEVKEVATGGDEADEAYELREELHGRRDLATAAAAGK